tara:strand:- start:3251 stop:3478 length:228 start_codon:yes stop_codon:yes gene_type:complete
MLAQEQKAFIFDWPKNSLLQEQSGHYSTAKNKLTSNLKRIFLMYLFMRQNLLKRPFLDVVHGSVFFIKHIKIWSI